MFCTGNGNLLNMSMIKPIGAYLSPKAVIRKQETDRQNGKLRAGVIDKVRKESKRKSKKGTTRVDREG